MAAKRKKKKSRKAFWLLLAATPFAVWLLAFVVWLYWTPIARRFGDRETSAKLRSKGAPAAERREQPARSDRKTSSEQITDDERKQLDEILGARRDRK